MRGNRLAKIRVGSIRTRSSARHGLDRTVPMDRTHMTIPLVRTYGETRGLCGLQLFETVPVDLG